MTDTARGERGAQGLGRFGVGQGADLQQVEDALAAVRTLDALPQAAQ